MKPLPPTDGPLTDEELHLAARNKSMPLEALQYDLTPIGMHYLLVHFDVPFLDDATHRLVIDGHVEHPLRLSADDLRARPCTTIPLTLECAGNGRAELKPRPLSQPWLDGAIGTAEWTGVPVARLLDEAGLKQGTVECIFTGADHGTEKEHEHDYARSLTVAELRRPETMIAFEMNGRPLEPQHGFPLRLIVPGWYGMTSVKWLKRIEAVTEPFEGYQQKTAYWYKQTPEEQGRPVDRIRPRALMAPPGFPDFFTRHRIVDAGEVTLTGRAWCGDAEITSVVIGIDGAFMTAELEPALGEFAWRRFTFRWNATPGEHVLTCRASDAKGRTQPLDAPWNLQGMGNNVAQVLRVTVR